MTANFRKLKIYCAYLRAALRITVPSTSPDGARDCCPRVVQANFGEIWRGAGCMGIIVGEGGAPRREGRMSGGRYRLARCVCRSLSLLPGPSVGSGGVAGALSERLRRALRAAGRGCGRLTLSLSASFVRSALPSIMRGRGGGCIAPAGPAGRRQGNDARTPPRQAFAQRSAACLPALRRIESSARPPLSRRRSAFCQ